MVCSQSAASRYRRPGRRLAAGLLAGFLAMLAPAAGAVILEGVGHAVILNGDLDSARAAAREAALRDLALRYEARVSTRETVENGVLTESRVDVATQARARHVEIVSEQRTGDRLRLVVRADMTEPPAICRAAEAARLKKRVAITGFPLLQPDQAQTGRLDDAGEVLPQRLQAGLRDSGRLEVLSATGLSLFGDAVDAPTWQGNDNRLSNVARLARELGAQFVVTGVIRDLGFTDPTAWDTSVWGGFKRSLGAVDQNRRFVVDLMVFDGFSGSPLYQERFATEAEWRTVSGRSTGFASAGFESTAYGQAVTRTLAEMTQAVVDVLACQPFMTRVVRVEGPSVTLASGATAGLRPGDELHVYRSARHWDALAGAPELRDAGVSVTLNNVHPEFSSGRMPKLAGQVNVQRDDLAIIW
ncbi:flagellar assembly protein T N-terminal domain-containing protein [Marinobacter lutaoensis]|uniref:flagellar assembly protein T N-terminal domain-containing protein n=1 Tax=Marinobacter lutaoensis TaxID=135739 RepID=UPI001593C229|nr:flagellar assembly protein T N-terminal domain-containing protein [Marinobacter lutaoensis]NVD34819.1 flagella assembly protein FlgT [Marinobacter lutaoensis]